MNSASPKIFLASHNPHKRKEFHQLFPKWEFMSSLPFDCQESESTYLGNALIKARALNHFLKQSSSKPSHEYSILADDSGLEVEALRGAPGVKSARYGSGDSKEKFSAEEQMNLLLEALGRTKMRKARFICSLVLLRHTGEIFAVQEYLSGEISFEIRPGSKREIFGYDPIFFLPSLGQTIAEIPPKQKNRLSHRFLAAQKLSTLFQKRFRGSNE